MSELTHKGRSLLTMVFNKFSLILRLFSFLLITFTTTFAMSSEVAKLRYSPQCILEALLKYRRLDYRPNVEFPHIYYESSTSLEQLNSALYPIQWSTPAVGFSNAFAYKDGRNEIYIMDEASYYQRHGRFIDDSLAHELYHYIQIRYTNLDIANDDFAELDAIVAQKWFRETFMLNPDLPQDAPCPDHIVK